MKRTILCVLLAAMMLFSLIPVTVSAAEGTAITNAAEFEAIANDPAGVYYLANDIDMGGKTYENYILADFSGKLDGCGHAIFNYTLSNGGMDVDVGTILRINKTAKDTVEVKNINFGKPDKPVVMTIDDGAQGQSHGILAAAQENNGTELVVDNVNIYADVKAELNGKINMGGYIGYSRFATITNSTMNGSILVGKDTPDEVYKNAAGFIASNNSPLTTIVNCTNNATITTKCSSTEARAAGIVSYSGQTMTLEKCVNNGAITVLDAADQLAASQAGGIFADINGDFVVLKDCVNNGQVSASQWCGGLVAYVRKAGVELDGCINYGAYNTAAAKADAFVAMVHETSGEVNVMTNCKDETGKGTAVTTAPVTTAPAPTTTAPVTTVPAVTTAAPATATTKPDTTPSTGDVWMIPAVMAVMALAALVVVKKQKN